MSLEGPEEWTEHGKTGRGEQCQNTTPAGPEGWMVEVVSPGLRIYNPPWVRRLPTGAGTSGKPWILPAERRADGQTAFVTFPAVHSPERIVIGLLITEADHRVCRGHSLWCRADEEKGVEWLRRQLAENTTYHISVYLLLFLHMDSEPPSGRHHAFLTHLCVFNTKGGVFTWILVNREKEEEKEVMGRRRRLQQLWMNKESFILSNNAKNFSVSQRKCNLLLLKLENFTDGLLTAFSPPTYPLLVWSYGPLFFFKLFPPFKQNWHCIYFLTKWQIHT